MSALAPLPGDKFAVSIAPHDAEEWFNCELSVSGATAAIRLTADFTKIKQSITQASVEVSSGVDSITIPLVAVK